MSARTPARSRQQLMSPKSTATAGGWRAKVRKGMKDVCHADMVDEALQKVMDAPDSKIDSARDTFCPPYKPARWSEFLVAVLGKASAIRFLAKAPDAPPSPVRAMRPLSPESAVRSPRVTSPSRSRRKSGRHLEHTPTNLDYVAVTSIGLIVFVMALALSPGGLEVVEEKAAVFIGLLTKTLGLKSSQVQWVTKVVTVGGTLALSGAVVGAAILCLASIVVYAVFASK